MSKEPDPAKKGWLGLSNLGNTCFMNAALQALRNSKEWTLFCMRNEIDPFVVKEDTKPKKVLSAYRDLLASLWGGQGPGYVIPRGFYDSLREVVQGTIYDDFTRRVPQDAHEFLVWLLDQMYMSTQGEVSYSIPNEGTLPAMQIQALKGWKDAFEKQYSPLADLAFGLYRIQYKCSACLTVHTRWETFNTLKYSLHMEGSTPLSLLECMKREFAEENIDEYACDTCAPKRAPATKKVEIWRLPKLLILTAKRFSPNGWKINYPMAPIGQVNFSDLFAQESTELSKQAFFQPFATVDHHGSHMGGHYTAQVESFVTNRWSHFDDESVNYIEKPNFGSSTYMVFLRPI